MFSKGLLYGECDLEFENDTSKPTVYPIKSYVGIIEDGMFSGQGVLTFTSGDVYDGDFVLGMREGKGVYKSKDKEFDGDWESDLLHGAVNINFIDGMSGNIDNIKFDRGIPSGNIFLPTIACNLEKSYLTSVEQTEKTSEEEFKTAVAKFEEAKTNFIKNFKKPVIIVEGVPVNEKKKVEKPPRLLIPKLDSKLFPLANPQNPITVESMIEAAFLNQD